MATQTREQIMLNGAVQPPRQTAAAQTGQPSGAPRPARKRYTKQSPAGEVVLGYLASQVARLNTLDLAVRRDKPDAVHQMRVTVRRLRSTLQSFTSILPEPQTRQLRAELKWLGGLLGTARDAEVLAGHLHGGLAAVPQELVLGPAQARITKHFAPVEAEARNALLAGLDSARYQNLRAALNRLVVSPPLTQEAAHPAVKVLPRAVRRDYRRTTRRMRRARQAPAGHEHDVALHETRKAAKRARYAAEAVEPALGKKSRRFGKRMKKVQSVLGNHQDAVIARGEARDIGVEAHLAGENAFSFGLLQERSHQQALVCQRQSEGAWRQAKRQARRWPPKK